MSRSAAVLAIALASWVGAAAAPSGAQQPGDGRVGTAAAVRGAVQLAALGPAPTSLARQVGTVVTSGSPLFLGDAIESGPGAGLQVLLADETVFTIGPDARLTIDEFVYSPAGGAGRLTATVARGAFRMISGKVAAAGPDAMRVRTPVATIGIRGTMVGGEVGQRGETFVVLLGPGPRAMAEGQRVGRIAVFANAAPPGQAVEITRAGFGTTVSAPSIAPPPPARIDQARIQQLGASLQSRGAPPPSPAAPAAQQGQGGAQAAAPQQQGQAAPAPGSEPPAASAAAAAAIEPGAPPPTPQAAPAPIVPPVAAFAPPMPTDLGAMVVDLGSAVRLAVQQANEQQLAPGSTTTTATNAAFTLPEIARQAQLNATLPQNVVLPLAIQLDWSNIPDLDLHMTAPDGAGGRAHVFFGNTGSYNSAPFVKLGNDRVASIGGSEVMAINGLTTTNLPADNLYRATVHNFGDQSASGTTLSSLSNATVKVVTGGTLDVSGNTGDRISGGTTRGVFTVPQGGAGNAWVVLEINPLTRVVKPVGTITNMPNPASAP
ncbi:MAG: hypothetical protein RLZZ276_1470 [Pseudomonadota bacterium]|jgi:hypothetical protein